MLQHNIHLNVSQQRKVNDITAQKARTDNLPEIDDIDLSIIALPVATFSTWLKYFVTDCVFDVIYKVDIMRSDPGVLMAAPWFITNTFLTELSDSIVMDASTRTRVTMDGIYIDTTTLWDTSLGGQNALLQFGGQTENVLKNVTYNYTFPIYDNTTALSNIELLLQLVDCINDVQGLLDRPPAISRLKEFNSLHDFVFDDINATMCAITQYPTSFIFNEGETVINNLTTIIEWDKQKIIDLFQATQDLSTYDFWIVLNETLGKKYPCIQSFNCPQIPWPTNYQFHNFEYFVSADFGM